MLKWKTEDFAKKKGKFGRFANQNARTRICLLQSRKKVQTLKAVKWIDHSSCWNEQLMQIPPSSWITFGTRQMVQPQNRDSTNFTERRFSQDSERKWIDGKIVAVLLCIPQAELSGTWWCLTWQAGCVPSIPTGFELKGKPSESELLRPVQSLSDENASSLQSVRASSRGCGVTVPRLWTGEKRTAEKLLFVPY